MKVKELIEKLKEIPNDEEIYIKGKYDIIYDFKIDFDEWKREISNTGGRYLCSLGVSKNIHKKIIIIKIDWPIW